MQRVRQLEDAAAGRGAPVIKSRTVAEASREYLSDCKQRNLAAASLRTYRKTLEHLTAFCGGLSIGKLTVDLLASFRAQRVVKPMREGDATRAVAPSTSRKELETLRGFLAFCVDRGWIAANPAKKIRPPKEDSEPTMPFEPAEVKKLLAACNKLQNNNSAAAKRARPRARALVLLLLYTGFRIGDAAALRRDRLDPETRYLFLRLTMKTKVPLRVRLSQEAVDALFALPVESDEFFFWSGRCKLSTVVGSLRRTITALGRITGIHAHPHRFRDTFACRLLDNGAEIRTVMLLLGHKSILTTERHYAPFVRSHQRLLDDAVATLRFDDDDVLDGNGK